MKSAWNLVIKEGNNVLIYTLTHYLMGRVKAVDPGAFVLEQVSWIADQGRMNDSLVNGVEKLGEVEPMPDDVAINLDAVVMATKWRHDLPKKVK